MLIPLLGDTSGARAYEHACERMAGRGCGLRGVMEEGGEERFEDELPGGQAFDDAHGRPAARARPGRSCHCGPERFVRRRRGDAEGLTTLGEFASTTARGEEAKIADPDEALREHMQEKPAQEFMSVEGQRADLAPMPIILPPKRDRVVGDGVESVIRDGDPVRIPREVVQHVGRTTEGRLSVDHPRLPMERSEERAEGHVRRERCEAAREMQATVPKGLA